MDPSLAVDSEQLCRRRVLGTWETGAFPHAFFVAADPGPGPDASVPGPDSSATVNDRVVAEPIPDGEPIPDAELALAVAARGWLRRGGLRFRFPDGVRADVRILGVHVCRLQPVGRVHLRLFTALVRLRLLWLLLFVAPSAARAASVGRIVQ